MEDGKFLVFQALRSHAARVLGMNGFSLAEVNEVCRMLAEDLPTEVGYEEEEITAKDAVRDYCFGLLA